MGDLRMVSSERVSPIYFTQGSFLQALLAVVNTVTGEHSTKKEAPCILDLTGMGKFHEKIVGRTTEAILFQSKYVALP